MTALRPGDRVSMTRVVERQGRVVKVDGDGLYVTVRMDDGSEVLSVGTRLEFLPPAGNGKRQ